jgi:hypothetical protein
MIDDLLHVAQQEFLRGREFYRAGAMPRALVAYHAGLEQLLRFALIRDGADYDRATDPNQINWQTLITYLDVRYALPREQCVFLSQMTHLRDQVLAGGNPELSPMVMQGYDKLVTQIFRRLYPRDQAARNEAAMRGTFAPRRPVADINARPPERANETNIIAPVAPPPEGPHPPVSAAGVSLPPTGLHPASIDRLGPAHPHGAATNPPPPAHASTGYQAHPPASAQAPANGGMPANGDSPPWAPQSPPTAPGHAAPVPSPDEQQRRAIEAGRRLREMRIQGLDYCPQCRSQIPITSPICPQCGFDVESYRARQAPAPPRAESLLDRFLGRR